MKKKLTINLVFLYLFFQSFNLFSQNWTDVYWENLVIYRDRWGIPHIFANEPRVLGFGFGYVQAQDHWEPMLLAYRLATGRLAEVMGEVESQSDKFSIQAGHRYYGTLAYEHCDAFTKDLCEGFAEGVNAWIVENREKLPEWVDGVNPKDIFSLWHAFIVSLAPLEHPHYAKRAPAIKSGFAFAYSAQKSKENLPLLAFSAHQFYQGPFRWYEAHLACGDYYVYGTTLYGLPLILQGHTMTHSWALTPNQADFSDVFLETSTSTSKSNPKALINQPTPDPAMLFLQYMSQSDMYYVRTANGLEERLAPVHITERGPLLLGDNNELFSWKIGGFEDIGIFRQLWEMGKAKSLDQFIQAIYLHQLPCFHILYANRDDQLFYFYSAKAGVRTIPPGLNEREAERLRSVDWRKPVPLQNYFFGWKYIIPPDQLPSIQNPNSGYLQICGGPPNSVTDDVRITTEDPTFVRLIQDVENVVSKRVKSVIRSDRLSLREAQSLLLDDTCALAIETVSVILSIWEKNKQNQAFYHPDLPKVIDILHSWDYRASVNSYAPTIFSLWTYYFSQSTGVIPSVEVDPYLSLLNKNELAEKDCLDALVESVHYLKNQHNTVLLPWGDIHKLQRGTINASLGGSETGGCAFLASELPPESERWGNIHYGIGYAQIISLGPVVESYSIMPFGNSDILGSTHYKDQWELFKERQMKKTYFYPEEIYHFAEEAIGRKIVFILPGDMGELRCVSSSKIKIAPKFSIEPIKELPVDMSPISLCYSFTHEPKDAYVQFLLKIRPPRDLIQLDAIPLCAIYTTDDESSWEKVQEQSFNVETGLFEALFERKSTFILLAPKEKVILSTQANGENSASHQSGGKGIFSPGLPGDIPIQLRYRDRGESQRKFVFQSQQSPQVLPKPVIIPPTQTEAQKEFTNPQRSNDNESKDKKESQKEERTKVKKQDKKDGDNTKKLSQPRKNFNVKTR